MAKIHPTAIVHPKAELAEDVEVGPYCIIGPNVVIDSGTVLGAHVVIEENTFIGKMNSIGHGAVLGAPPQDRKFKHERTYLRIGDNNLIREYVTIHRASGEGEETVVGNNCFLMAYSHIGHNTRVGDGVVMANSVGISGHCIIEDGANLGGMTGVHQYTRIGRLAMVGGMSRITRDVPPYLMVEGNPAEVHGVNLVGLKRAGIPEANRTALRVACRLLYFANLNTSQAIERIRAEVPLVPEVEHLLRFVEEIRQGRNGRYLDQPSRK
ncbi:MAG: acyl-ACP--UDP-N-acetylglucosamine O-acyltransferase [Fimbriimonadales bacterium]|nr:acyl-ACP--UDP-N-acetylglucosamine O-acyltransferase [Armatimonadota bacterium]MCX7688630.1 acyl-ACP--UDP-N-acetylglucosamine O-acyltransferase [Fimbriimonadales bacterium]CUU36757.1 acyl-[acyl-carrier-protein]--UDP-N-acetylglucosamine O-acyltransferase [Armatimonadetes bacterium DC]